MLSKYKIKCNVNNVPYKTNTCGFSAQPCFRIDKKSQSQIPYGIHTFHWHMVRHRFIHSVIHSFFIFFFSIAIFCTKQHSYVFCHCQYFWLKLLFLVVLFELDFIFGVYFWNLFLEFFLWNLLVALLQLK